MPTIAEFESLVTKEVATRTELVHFVLWSRNHHTAEEVKLMGDFTHIVLQVLAKKFPTLVYDSGYVRLARHSLPSYLAVLDAAKALLRIHIEITEQGFDARKAQQKVEARRSRPLPLTTVPQEVEARRARPLPPTPLLAGNNAPAIRREPSETPQTIQHSKMAESISALRSIETNVERPAATPTSRTPTTVVSTPASTPASTPTPAERPLRPRTSSYEWARSKSTTPPELTKRHSTPAAPAAAESRSPPVEAVRQRTASTAAEAPRQRTASTAAEAPPQRTSYTAAEAPRERQRTSSTAANGTAGATTPAATPSKSSPPVALLSDPAGVNALPRPQRSRLRTNLPAGAMPPGETTFSKPLVDVDTPPKVGTPPTPTTPAFVPCPTMPWGLQLSLTGSPKVTPSPPFMAKNVPASPSSRPSSLVLPERPASILVPSRPNSMISISPCVTRLPAEPLASSNSLDASSLSKMLAEAKAPEKKVRWRLPWTGSSDPSDKPAPDKKTSEKKASDKADDKTAGGKTHKKVSSLLGRSSMDRK